MIKERYCSYEVARLLNKKGFDETCYACYEYFKSSITMYQGWVFEYKGEVIQNSTDIILAPTHQMACDWLREVHHIYIEICFYKTNPNDIEPKKSRLSPYYTFGVWDTISGNNIDKRLTNDFIGDSYKEAVEAALKYVLENLI